MSFSRVSLDQWYALQAVVDHGGFAQAAQHLYRSQSSVSYAIQKLQQQLGVKLLRIEGRRAVLTEAGEALLHRARRLISDAKALEALAQELDAGWEAEINLVVDAAFPIDTLMHALRSFSQSERGTRVQLQEVVLSGAEEVLQTGRAELVIGTLMSGQNLADHLVDIEFIAVAHPQHALHQLTRELSYADLQDETQIVIRDSGQQHDTDVGWLGADQRWTVSSIDRAISITEQGLGYAWLPRPHIVTALQQDTLRPLRLPHGQAYHAQLYLHYGKQQHTGPATRLLAQCLKDAVKVFSAANR